MANDKHAYITMQGDLLSRKLHDPSGFLIMAPTGFKTFTTLKAAVLWTLKKGFVPHLVTPPRPTGQSALATVRFDQALDEALAELEAATKAASAAQAEA